MSQAWQKVSAQLDTAGDEPAAADPIGNEDDEPAEEFVEDTVAGEATVHD